MGQEEILNMLRVERENGNETYYTSAEICRKIGRPLNPNVYVQINQLAKFQRLEVIAYSVIPLKRGFRYKKITEKK
jgi:hypothetical protein